ncbi:MAG TPA: hypothetical protein VIW80_10425 [Pyrinomonadaceae bacterium]|jgi:hypothetical protein
MTKKTLAIILGVVGGLLLLVLLFVGAIVGGVFYIISHSEAAATARSFLQSNAKLKEDIGEVKEFGSIITGSIKNNDAQLNIKVIGERRTVNATVVLMYRHSWRVTGATYRNEQGQTVELLDKYGPAPPEQ